MIQRGGVLYGADEMVARYVNDLCGGGFEIGRIDSALGILGPDGMIGGVVFSNYQPGRDITVTVAAESTICGHPRIIARILAYPFEQLALPRVSAEIEPDNTRSLRNAKLLGFVEEGVKRGSGVVMLGLLRDEFKFKHLMGSDERSRSTRATAGADGAAR